MAFRRNSERYVGEEDEARASGVDLWAGAFDHPGCWRAKLRGDACQDAQWGNGVSDDNGGQPAIRANWSFTSVPLSNPRQETLSGKLKATVSNLDTLLFLIEFERCARQAALDFRPREI